MPEGDTIWRTAETLRDGLEGKQVRVARPDRLKRLAGCTVTEVKPVGKHLVIRFDNGLAIHSHMRMNGAWHVYKRGERWRRPAWQVRALLETDDVVAVCFAAPVVDLIRDEVPKVGHLGPDILSDGWAVADVIERARSLGPTPIGELLLDQRVTAGIGNVYRCEALWMRRINPWKSAAEISDQELAALFEAARQAMRANLDGGPRRRFPGYGRGAVHGRGGRPCPRCGARIQVRAQGEQARLAYWCPACQP
ncbi:MAG: Fpg/Nei family DNA glycosylase [Chloroflexi bacterium]|nr:MAG: Fpg/Nei family DNA glycosylase [Chloroflexota bacterium]TMF35337.1 MAG: Fpg/Nei family DNA glycosylase [Chloroflexota bacterium]TMG12202.1 MAG: Fpg/Nei family DNA glycosylase [Chloroflexota bacterium]